MQTILAPGTGRNGTERFGDWLVGEAGETQGCRYFFKNSVCEKVYEDGSYTVYVFDSTEDLMDCAVARQ